MVLYLDRSFLWGIIRLKCAGIIRRLHLRLIIKAALTPSPYERRLVILLIVEFKNKWSSLKGAGSPD
tara:strand:+ start:299 stop:499 length:201 start_codon:yes stop_codon:yes gene_type:complete